MAKTKHLVMGAAALSVTILSLYQIAQPHDHIMTFFSSNHTSNRGSSTPSQILTSTELPVDSPARKMFRNELLRISLNLKSGRIADQNPDPPVVYNKKEPEIAKLNVQQPDHNQGPPIWYNS
jgi:hypothetical protein